MKLDDVIVLSVNRYHVIDTDGTIVEGCGVRYAVSDSLLPVEKDDQKGYRLGKAVLSYADFEKFGPVPGLYEAEAEINVASDGTVKVVAKEFFYKDHISNAVKGSAANNAGGDKGASVDTAAPSSANKPANVTPSGSANGKQGR